MEPEYPLFREYMHNTALLIGRQDSGTELGWNLGIIEVSYRCIGGKREKDITTNIWERAS